MTYDPNQRFAQGQVSVAPSPATSGLSLSVDVHGNDPFAAAPLAPAYALVRPPVAAHKKNAETIRVDSHSAGTRTGTIAISVLLEGLLGIGSVTITERTKGGGGSNEVQAWTTLADGGTYKLGFKGVLSGTIAPGASAATIQTALNAVSSIASYADLDITEVAVGGPGVNAQQQLAVIATGGNYKLSLDGVQTGLIAWNASDATIQTALEGLANIGTGNVSVSSGLVTFQNDLAGTPQPLLVADTSALTGTGSVTVAVDPSGPASSYLVTFGGGLLANRDLPLMSFDVSALTQSLNGRNEQVLVALNADAGTWTLTFGGNTTSPAFNWNQDAATVQSRLQALASIGSGNVTVTGDNGGPYTLTFVNGKGNQNVGAVTGTVVSLTINTRTFTIVRAQKGSTARAIAIGDVLELGVMPLRPQLSVVPETAGEPVIDVTSVPVSGGEALVTRNTAAGFPTLIEYPATVMRDSTGAIVFQTYPVGAVSGITPAAGDNSTKFATTEYADRAGGDSELFAFFLGG